MSEVEKTEMWKEANGKNRNDRRKERGKERGRKKKERIEKRNKLKMRLTPTPRSQMLSKVRVYSALMM